MGLSVAQTAVTNHFVWNLFTSAFYEKYILKLLAGILMVTVVCPPTNRISYSPWDAFGLYIVLSVLSMTVLTSAYVLVRFFSTGHEDILFDPVYGCSGILISAAMYTRLRMCKGQLVMSSPNM